MSAEDDRSFRATIIQNDSVSLGAGESITFHMGSGTDTSSDRYMGLNGGYTYGIEIIPTVACSISKVNNASLKSSISVGTGGYSSNNVKIESIKIQAGSATTVEVSAKGGY